MNIHTIVDNLTAWTGALAAGKNKFFSKSITSQTFEEYFKSLDMDIPDIAGEERHFVEVKSPDIELDPAFWVAHWTGWNSPTIIFHHGNNENPFNTSRLAKHSFQMIFGSNLSIDNVNIIAIRAPFHGDSLKDYSKRITDLSNFVALISTSVALTEKLITQLKNRSNQTILISGISLGGWVTNLHRTYFNTADLYVPLLAGAALAEVFLTSKYKRLTGVLALQNPEIIRNQLTFEDDFEKNELKNVFPLLGRYDQFIQFERQKKCYKSLGQPQVLDKGHVTSLLAASALYQHIITTLKMDAF